MVDEHDGEQSATLDGLSATRHAPVGSAQDVPASESPDIGPATSMQRRLWALYPIALISLAVVWVALTSVLLGRQVASIVPDPIEAAGSLGLTLSIGSFIGLFAQPILGRFSDLTRVRFMGRRNVWILFGGIGGALGLVGLAFADSLIAITVGYAVVMLPMCGLQAAMTAVLPERVPLVRRGLMSGIVGTTQILGGVIGQTITGFADSVLTGYLVIAAIMLTFTTIFSLVTKDRPAPPSVDTADRQARRAAARLPGLREARDFWLTFASRFFVIFGYMSISGFSLYLLRDYIKVGDGSIEAASQTVAMLAPLSFLALIFSLVGGILSDKSGKVRIFVGLSAIGLVPGAAVILLMPTLTGYVLGSLILGAGFGVYMAVDQVLITRVLPSERNVARDLGLMNIANAGPNTLAPAIAGALIAATGGYQTLFLVAMISFALAATVIRFIKSVP